MQREPTPRTRALPLLLARCAALRTGFAAILLSSAALVPCTAQVAPAAQPVSAQAARPAGSASTSTVREEGVRWSALTPSQREALAPLEHDWRGIDAPRKQKWIALAARFKTLSPEERARISARMAEWAKMTPAERGQARLRFEEARQLPVPDRTERWRAYQALPTEQREQLAARAKAASAPRDGASKPPRNERDKEAKFNVVPNPALAQPPRPVAPTLVQAAPGATTTVITRRPAPPAHQQTGMPKIAITPEFVNRSTLLPRRSPAASAPSSASSHAAVRASASASAPAQAPAPLAARPSSATSR